jgi:PKD repeat protein
VRFQYNLFRNIAAGANVLGYDSKPTRQTANISFAHNVFIMTTSLGGPARFMQIDAGPRDIVLEHNTIDANGSGVVYVVGGLEADPAEVQGFQMIANAARHGSYGIHGAHFLYGNEIIAHYFPGAVFESNYLAGAVASKYPSGTLVTPPFEDQFVNTAAGDYTVRRGSILEGAGPGNSHVGADYPGLLARVRNVPTGDGDTPNAKPTAAFASACVDLTCRFTDTSADGDGSIAARAWTFGSTGSSTAANPTFKFPAPGTYTVSLTVTDNDGARATRSAAVSVTAALHAALLPPTTKKWTSASGATNYWSAAVTAAAHGADERPIPGATITVAWSGAVTKTASCVTASTGQCTLQSGTLSYLRSWVTLTVTTVSAPLSTYAGTANHTAGSPGSAVTINRP